MRSIKRELLILTIISIGLTFSGFAQERQKESVIAGSVMPFTYQGKLTVNGTAANGSYDLIVQLYSEPERGDLLGEQTIEDVQVVNGIFTVNLEFETGLFQRSETAYIDIWVKSSDGGDEYVQLTPRQQVGSTPYAKVSDSSKTADLLNCSNCITNGHIVSIVGSKVNGTVANATNSQQLGGVAADQYVLTGDPRLADERAPTAGSTNYIQNSTAQQTSSNFNISGNGFIGGNLGVGGSSPVYKVSVVGNAQGGVRGESVGHFGMEGISLTSIGVRGEGQLMGVSGRSSSGFGVHGEGGTYGVRGEGGVYGLWGRGQFGVYGVSSTSGGLAGAFEGDVHISGTLINSSDARLKKDIGTLGYGLRDVMRLRPVSWNWKARPESGMQLGFIAQEVETVMPELVSTVRKPEKDAEETKGLNYTGLIPVLIKAVQEQQKEIETLKAANAELATRLASLEKASESPDK
ncbi:MAG: tail fiber domain-containing protein [Acidobacteria bacterium]|nr:tail fiber domain-containing protein [Acidobacteriota bacterium]